MRIVVFMKQVPPPGCVRFTRANRIEREGVAGIANPLDLEALAHALALRGVHGGEVTVATMGPPAARTMLEDALARGADTALHLVDRRFAGADTLATARALARAIDARGADLLVFGRSTLDGATGQVGPQVAELLGLPFVGQAVSIARTDDGVEVERETERGWDAWRLPLPAAVSVERGPAAPEPAAGGVGPAMVLELDFDALGGTPRDYGTRGSPTFVRQVRELSPDRAGERVEGAEQGAARIRALVETRAARATDAPPHAAGDPVRALWALAEHDGARLHPVSLEAVACARAVAGELAAEVVSVVLADDPGDAPRLLAAHGADRVLCVVDPALRDYSPGAHTDALDAALEHHSPFAVIGPWTTRGREYLARVAARRGLGLTGDFVRLEVAGADSDEPDLMWIKPAWAATVEAPIIAHTTPSLGTLRPGAVRPLPADGAAAAAASVETFEPALRSPPAPVFAGSRAALADGEPLVDAAPVIVLAGTALGADGVEAAAAAARALGCALGATPRAVADGLAPAHREVGLPRRSLSPLCVIALGVEGDDALDGVRAARTLVAVDADARAPALAHADLAVVAEPAALARALAGPPAG